VYEDKRVCITIRFWKIIHDTSWTKFNSRDFQYTALFIRAAEIILRCRSIEIITETFETSFTMNEGQVMLVDSTTAPTGVSGILTGATVKSDKPIGVDVHWSGVDAYPHERFLFTLLPGIPIFITRQRRQRGLVRLRKILRW